MPKIFIEFPIRRRLAAAAAAVAGFLLLAGCGGSGHGSSANHSSSGGTVTTGSALVPLLVKAMAANQPNLKSVKVRCPSGAIKRYPVKCHFNARAGLTAGKGKHVKAFTLPTAGTVSVNQVKGAKIKYYLQFASKP